MPKHSKTSRNPFSFTPVPVTILISIVYIAIFTALLVVHHTVPEAPSNPTHVKGINITEAWHDVQVLSNGYRPYNSHRNDEVRNWLLKRIEQILEANGVDYATEGGVAVSGVEEGSKVTSAADAKAVVFNDLVSNTTASTQVFKGTDEGPGISVYFEGTNIMVYIRGSNDEPGDWWNSPEATERASRVGGVMVNAHYDSVSTGHGTTDDGMGVITVLQLIKFFSTEENKPRKGLVALLNNGEEDFLNGARAFMKHPLSKFAHSFLNLEGAGAGGRAALFRSTDFEVTKFYKSAPHPFGTVSSADGFKRGAVRSETDYKVFYEELGLRGLDVAFMEPRARYHTDQDSTRYASIDSLWHMLSAALATVEGLTSENRNTFVGDAASEGKVNTGKGSDGVWFDLFGSTFGLFQLHSLFAISVTLLVVTPLILLVLAVILIKVDKMYLFSGKVHLENSDSDEGFSIKGKRGSARYILAVIIAGAVVVGLAFLIVKINPYIIYSSPYSVWSMMLCAWFSVAWFVLRGADQVRPTALQRNHALLWRFVLEWILLVAVTVTINNMGLASGYFLVITFACLFLAVLISFIELFSLPKKGDLASLAAEDYSEETEGDQDSTTDTDARLAAPARDEEPANEGQNQDEEATESTSLLRNRPTFANYRSSRVQNDSTDELANHDPSLKKRTVFGSEQPWSAKLPTWTWVIQFLLLAPLPIILTGHLGLYLTTALYQTGADGNSMLLLYIFIAILSILILTPISPFVHRITHHIPIFLFHIFLATLLYNLLSFPFSAQNRMKVYFGQTIDLDNQTSTVTLVGLNGYVQRIAHSLPSALGKDLECSSSPTRIGLTECSWPGIPPSPVDDLPPASPPGTPPSYGYADWISHTVTRTGPHTARVSLAARNSRACKILFDSAPLIAVSVDGADAPDPRLEPVPRDVGARELRLWSREWERGWNVTVEWKPVEGDDKSVETQEEGLDGRLVCLWSDWNALGIVPALDEVVDYGPSWAVPTKLNDGLVEAVVRFMV